MANTVSIQQMNAVNQSAFMPRQTLQTQVCHTFYTFQSFLIDLKSEADFRTLSMNVEKTKECVFQHNEMRR